MPFSALHCRQSDGKEKEMREREHNSGYLEFCCHHVGYKIWHYVQTYYYFTNKKLLVASCNSVSYNCMKYFKYICLKMVAKIISIPNESWSATLQKKRKQFEPFPLNAAITKANTEMNRLPTGPGLHPETHKDTKGPASVQTYNKIKKRARG